MVTLAVLSFRLEYDPDLNLSIDEKTEAHRRMSRYGQWNNDGSAELAEVGWWTPRWPACWSPPERDSNARGRIVREGFVIVEEK
jgi:hypothetical protein